MRIYCLLLISLVAEGTISYYEATEHPCQTEGETQNGYTCFAMFETGQLVWYKHVDAPAQKQGGCRAGVDCNQVKNQVVDCNKFYCGENPQCKTAAREYYNCCCGGHHSSTKLYRDSGSQTTESHVRDKVYPGSVSVGPVAPPHSSHRPVVPSQSHTDYSRQVSQPVQYKIGNTLHSSNQKPPVNNPNAVQYINRPPQQIVHPSQSQYAHRVPPPQVNPQYVNRAPTPQVNLPLPYANPPPVQYINRPNQATVSTSTSKNSVSFAPPGKGQGNRPVQVVQPNNVLPAAQQPKSILKKPDQTKYTVQHRKTKKGASFTLTLNDKNHDA